MDPDPSISATTPFEALLGFDASVSSAAFTEALRIKGVSPRHLASYIIHRTHELTQTKAGIYLLDINAKVLCLLEGAEYFPHAIPFQCGIGPEIPLDCQEEMRQAIQAHIPEAVVAPLFLQGRIMGCLFTETDSGVPLDDLASLAIAAFHIAGDHTDIFKSTIRVKQLSPSAELQEGLLPPRIAPLDHLEIAGAILPAYQVGGDWFDYAENKSYTWVGVGDSMGKGARAQAVSALAIGAIRSVRRKEGSLIEMATTAHRTIMDLEGRITFLTCILGSYNPHTRVFEWINCGHLPPWVFTAGGEIRELATETEMPLGIEEQSFTVHTTTLNVGDRLVLYSDGITERKTDTGRLGSEGLEAGQSSETAASTVMSIQHAVEHASSESLSDDATLLVLRVLK